MKLKNCLEWILAAALLGIAPPTKASQGDDQLATQHFFCNTGYALDACHSQLNTLKTVVARFPAASLGEWTWVLVRSQDWTGLSRTLGLNPYSPAFTCLETRTTFIEEVLVAKVPWRASELVTRWHMGMTDLLNVAVEHEMGHAFCHSRDEDKANHVAGILERKRPINCQSEL